MNLGYRFIAASCFFWQGFAGGDDGRLAIENREQVQSLERQQQYYQRKLEALGGLSRPDQQRLDRQLQRQRFKQQLLQHRQVQQPSLPLSRSGPAMVSPSAQIQQFERAQRSQQLHFKIERNSWHYPGRLR
jgi:hypothetical protein